MKKLSDEEIQQLLDEGLAADISNISDQSIEDLQAYRLLFDALDQQAVIETPSAFASAVTAKILAKKNRRADITFFALLAAVFCFFAGL